MPNYSGVWSLPAVYQAVAQGNWPSPPPPPLGDRAIFWGGESGAANNSIVYLTISTTGNTTNFGDLLTTSTYTAFGNVADYTRGIFAGGGSDSSSGSFTNIINYITIETTGNATDFGDLTLARRFGGGGNNGTRGVFMAGQDNTGAAVNLIDYITIASAGNATDFGDTTVTAQTSAGASSSTRVVRTGSGGSSNVIDYITTATTGNATDFGDLPFIDSFGPASCSNSTRGLFAGFFSGQQNTIVYITIATTGNATDFGDLTVNTYAFGGTSNATRGIFGGGIGGNTIGYVTIATTGNATDFGDLTESLATGVQACSNGNGGLQ